MDDTSEPTTSDLFKIVRAVDGDTSFRLRAEMALEIAGKPTARQNLIFIAKEVVNFIECTVEGTVSTENVTDNMIVTAIESVPIQA